MVCTLLNTICIYFKFETILNESYVIMKAYIKKQGEGIAANKYLVNDGQEHNLHFSF